MKKDIKCDVLIVGGGFCGISAAAEFYGKGLSVVLIEKNIVGGSSSGRSAGFLTPDSELELEQLVRRFGVEAARDIWDAPLKGIDRIVNGIKKLDIPGASVIVHVWGPGDIGHGDVFYNLQMDENSHYEGEVASSLYAFDAHAFMPLNGHTVCIGLESLDDIPAYVGQASKPGIIKDFELKLTGLAKGGDPTDANSYYGAHIWVGDGDAFFSDDGYWDNLAINHPGGTVVFTLTPESALIDRSEGKTIQISCTVEDLQAGKYLVNIPYALYQLTATLVKANNQQVPLKLTHIPGITDTHTASIDLTFPPDSYDYPIIEQVAVWEN